MQKEYKVQKGESLQDVVIKLYGSLEYQSKFIADNNLFGIDITQPQLYQNDNRIICQVKFDSIPPMPYPYQNVICTKKNDEYISKQQNVNYNGNITIIPSLTIKKYNVDTFTNIWSLYLTDAPLSVLSTTYTNDLFPFLDNWAFLGTAYVNATLPYFEPFTVVYDDSIIKSVVPAITPTQMNTESNLKSLKVFNGQSFYDIALMAHGNLENAVKMAYDNNIDIDTFDYSEKKSIIYYNTDIKNTLIYNFMQTLSTKPATALPPAMVVPPTPGTQIAFNQSFNISFE